MYITSTYVCRFCQRVIPVSVVCHATAEDIKKKATSVLAPHFYQNDRVLKVGMLAGICFQYPQLYTSYSDQRILLLTVCSTLQSS